MSEDTSAEVLKQSALPVKAMQKPSDISPVSADLPMDISPVSPEGAATPTGSEMAAKPSGIPGPKISGLKPPSKIGRPCLGQTKPALPPVPAKNSPDSEVKRDEYRRQKLTDVEEEVDENDVGHVEKRPETPSPRKTRNYSVSSNMSWDTLWDMHPRRLSEAGLRRYSDTSVVLTEDTDCFIIGMRVWVGGTKPGQIAYLGETQFAPGEWAGIVLDEPIGKNDGSVSGIRYFQCESKRGVFSRLTRLTLAPLPEAVVAEVAAVAARTPPTNGVKRSPISPTGSTRGMPSLNTSTTSLSSMHPDVKVGDRVIVQSSQGSKPGTLRFIGPTDFAKGEWCGVELDDPLGKNDGTVEGKRYFTCQPKFGLFAPISKVSKSPSSRRPAAQCVVHKGTFSGTPTPSVRRTGSRESLTSMTSATSAASGVRRVRLGVTSLSAKKPIPKATSTPLSKTPLQDVLHEKEHHIEQLLKEREFDRAEITRVAGQAERAQGQFLALQQEYEKYRLEAEVKNREQAALLSQLEKVRQNLASQLDDEKKKFEDAQFRFEEESLTKDDIEAANKKHIEKIKELEESLKNEHAKNEKLEQQTKRLFETEEILARIQEEMESLQKSQDKVSKNIEAKDSEIFSLKQKLEETLQVLIEKQERLKDKTKDIESIKAENNILIQEKEDTLGKLREELNTANKLLKEKHIGNEIILLKELKKVEMDLSAKTFDCETSSEKVRELEKKVSHLEEELKSVKSSEGDTEKEKRWKNSMEEIRGILKSTISELLRVRKEHALEMLDKEMALREKDIQLKYELLELQKLKTDFSQTLTEFSLSNKSCKERYAKQIELRNQQIEELFNNLQSRSKELVSKQIFANKLEGEVSRQNVFIAKLKAEIEAFQTKNSEQSDYIQKLTEELKIYKLKANEFERKFHNAEQTVLHLKESKQQHEFELRALVEASKDSNAQLGILNEELRRVEQNLDALKLEMAKKLDAASSTEQELRFLLQSAADQHKIDKSHLQQQLKIVQDSEAVLREKLQIFSTDSCKVQEELQQQIVDLNKTIESRDFEAKKQLEVHVEKIKELEQILEMAVAEGQQVSSGLSRRIEELTAERDQLKISVKEKIEMLVEAEGKVREYLSNHDSLHQKQISGLETDLQQVKKKVEECETKLQEKLAEIDALKKERGSFEENLKEQCQLVESLSSTKTETEKSCVELKKSLCVTEEKVNELTKQLNGLQEEKVQFERLLNEHKNQIGSLSTEVKELQVQNSNISNTVLEKEEKMSQILEEVKQIHSQKSQLESTVAEKENKISALTTQLEEIIKEKGTTSETFAVQEKKILDLNMELQKVMQEKVTLSNELPEKLKEITALQEKLNIQEQELKKNVENKQAEINTLKQQIESLKLEKENILKTVDDKVQSTVSLGNEIQTLQCVKSKLEESNKDTTTKLNQLQTELEKMTTCNVTNEEKIADLTTKLKDKENCLSTVETELQKLKTEWEQPQNHPIVKEINSKLDEREKTLKDQEAEINNLNDRLRAISKEQGTGSEIITAQEVQISGLKGEVEKLQQEKSGLKTEVHTKETLLAKIKEELETQNNKLDGTIKDKDKELSSLKEQIQLLQKEEESKLGTIQDKEQNISKLTTDLNKFQEETINLKNSLKEAEQKFLILKEESQKTGDNSSAQLLRITNLENSATEKDKTITALKQEVDGLKKEWEQPTNNQLIKEVTSKLEEKQKELLAKDQESLSLNTQLQVQVQQNHQLQQTWKMSVQQWKAKLSNLEKIRQLATQQCESLEEQVKLLSAQAENVQKIGNGHLKDVEPVQFEEFKKQIDADIKELHSALEKTQVLLLEREKELSTKKRENDNLQKKLQDAQKQITEASVATAVPVSGIPKRQAKATNENICDMDTYKKMEEEKKFAVGQVEFLNSIIVDMQQKNKELQSKIQMLENGYFGDSPPNENITNVSRVIPPRQYCDICEVFDQHETEDCPVQMTDGAPVVRDPDVNRVLPEPRSYCEICEEFGHNTEDCDADETY